MGSKGAVEGGVLAVACATAVEALEADIEAVGVVLSEMGQDQIMDDTE